MDERSWIPAGLLDEVSPASPSDWELSVSGVNPRAKEFKPSHFQQENSQWFQKHKVMPQQAQTKRTTTKHAVALQQLTSIDIRVSPSKMRRLRRIKLEQNLARDRQAAATAFETAFRTDMGRSQHVGQEFSFHNYDTFLLPPN